MTFREERLVDGVTLYLGDCREVVPTLPRHGAVVTDPPYGQRQNTNIKGANGVRMPPLNKAGRGHLELAGKLRRTAKGIHSSGLATQFPEGIRGDEGPFDPRWLLPLADVVLLWGAHRFGHLLPEGSTLVWDKVPTGKVRDQGDGEAAWLNAVPVRPLRIYRLLWDGVCVGSAARDEVFAGQRRVHPTQKPVALMSWCLGQARLPGGAAVLDPYMGAGSTGVAAVRARHPFTGVEVEPVYFELALRRVEDALRRPTFL